MDESVTTPPSKITHAEEPQQTAGPVRLFVTVHAREPDQTQTGPVALYLLADICRCWDS